MPSDLSILTLDDETKTKTAKGQVSKHWLLLRLAHNITLCNVTAKLESQSELGRLNIFDLKGKKHQLHNRCNSSQPG